VRWQVNAARKIEEEAKRRKAILQEREEARLWMETEEVGQEAGMNTVGYFFTRSILTNVGFVERLAAEQRLREEQEAAEAAKHKVEAKAAVSRNGKKNKPLQLRRCVSGCTARKKPKSGMNGAMRSNAVLPGIHLLFEL